MDIDDEVELDGRLTAAEVDCALLNIVLSLSFHPDELANWARSAGVHLGVDPTDPDTGWATYLRVHEAIHDGSQVSDVVTQALDCIHRRAIDALDRDGVPSFADALLRGDPRRHRDLAGRLWALATSDQEGAADLAACAGARLSVLALQQVARGADAAPTTHQEIV